MGKKKVTLLMLFLVAHTCCSAQATGKVRITISPVYMGKPLQMGNHYYVNAFRDTLFIDAFRIYISNFCLAGNTPGTYINSHLLDAEDSNTYSYILTSIPRGNYNSVHFIAGVDSVANVSGANDGDLDPVKGMYWAWNSGYIMAKLEGHSRVCKTLHHAFEFHIGGYMPPYNAARNVTLNLPVAVEVSEGNIPAISLKADVAAWINNIDLARTNSVLTPGIDAAAMADKYAGMFSIEKVTNTPPPGQ